MAITSIFEEDSLVPIALTSDALYLFSRLRGELFRTTSTGEPADGPYEHVSLAPLTSPFSLPGHGATYDIAQSRGVTAVSEYVYSDRGLIFTRKRWHRSPSIEHHRFLAPIPSPTKSGMYLLYSPISVPGQYLLLDVSNGNTLETPSAIGIPRFVFSDGSILTESARERWSIYDAGLVVLSGKGAPVCAASDFAIVRQASKEGDGFVLVRHSGQVPLHMGGGWVIVSAVASNSVVLAYAVHPILGQRVFRANPDTMTFTPWLSGGGTSELFSLGAHSTPIIRCTGVASGSRWRTPDVEYTGIFAPREDLEIRNVMVEGMPCVTLRHRTETATRLVVSLHGGPDSHELDDLRYGGMYRDLLDVGCEILIVNYPGSKSLGRGLQRVAWNNWESSARRVARAVARLTSDRHHVQVWLFGTSFGAWMALQIACHVAIDQIIALSPVLNVVEHLDRHRDTDQDFRIWAERRFGDHYRDRGEGQNQVLACPSPVCVLVPDSDEIVSPDSTIASVRLAQDAGRRWDLWMLPGTHYPRRAGDATIRWAALRRAFDVRTRGAQGDQGHPRG